MNYCCLLILLYLFCGNGCGTGTCGRNRNCCPDRRRNDCCCEGDNSSRRSSFSTCGCEDEMIQPRAFSGFSNMGTCGCEEKSENDGNNER